MIPGDASRWEARSVTSEVEHAFVEWVFAANQVRHSLFGLLDVGEPADAYARVPLARLDPSGGANGDADALILQGGDPARACAVELKRITMSDTTFATELPGKLNEMPKAIAQGSKLADLGFSASWTVFLVQVDGRGRGGWVGSGPTAGMVRPIEERLRLHRVPEHLGVGRVDICQPKDAPIADAGALSSYLYRSAARRAQPPALTEAIARYALTARPFAREQLLFSAGITVADMLKMGRQ